MGASKYPWGDYYPPNWDDGNYAVAENGKDDPQKVGVDGIKGTAPVGSFKANVLGFYDLEGNVAEWVWNFDQKAGTSPQRGGDWLGNQGGCAVAGRGKGKPEGHYDRIGFRVALSSVP